MSNRQPALSPSSVRRRPIRPVRLGAALVISLSLVAAACGRDDETTTDGGNSSETTAPGAAPFIDPAKDCLEGYEPTKGVNGTEILVGTVRPTTGPARIYDTVTKGLEKYFESVNAKGGVKAGDGTSYTIKLVKGDDGYDPGKTPGVVQSLVETDGIFAMVGQIGTETNEAVKSYMNTKCVPSIGLSTGSPGWGQNNTSPWYIGGLPSYALEAGAFLDFYSKTKPEAKIALLYQNDDFGKAYQGAIKKWITDNNSKITLVAEQPYDATSSQTTEAATAELAGSGADLFFVGIGGSQCPITLTFIPATWTPDVYTSITCSGKLALSLAQGKDEGIYSTQATLDPASAEDQTNAKVQAFLTDGAAVGLTKDELEGGIVSVGWGLGALFARSLELSPKMTRADVMNTLWQFDGEQVGLFRDGVPLTTDNDVDPWLIEAMRVVKRTGGQWVEAGPIVDYAGTSNSFAS